MRMGALAAPLDAGNVVRERLPIRPDGAIFKIFFLPDWHGALEGIDEPAAGVKRGCPMGRRHHDQYTGLADFQTSQSMDNRDVANLVLFQRLFRQRLHLLDGHFFIAFVLEIKSSAATSVVAHNAFKYGGGPVLGLLDGFEHGSAVDDFPDN